MVRRSETSIPSDSPATEGPVFVDGSGRRLRRLRLFGAITLAGVVLYLAMIATAFFGGSDVVMPFLPLSAAGDTERPVPTSAPAPEPVHGGPAQPGEPAASESPAQPEPSPEPTAAPDPAEPAVDAPGRSEDAPGQTNSPEPSAPPHP